MSEYLGWAATAVFVGSYLCSRDDALKRVQIVGALMWACYGVVIGATPVVAANLLVVAAAAWALRRPLNSQLQTSKSHDRPTGRRVLNRMSKESQGGLRSGSGL